MNTVKTEQKEDTPAEVERQERIKNMPKLEACYNLMDFEAVARYVMKKPAWAYYSSGADDEITMRENHSAFHKIWFRPRVLVDVENVDISTTMLGTKVDIPFYVTATALGKLGHPEGEVVLTRGAKKHNVVQMIPTLASCSFDEIVVGAGQAGPPLAGRLTAAGQTVAVVERKLIGGTCVNNGCVPTKTLVASAHAAHLARRGADYGVGTGPVSVDMAKVKARKDRIMLGDRNGVEEWLNTGMDDRQIMKLSDRSGATDVDMLFGKWHKILCGSARAELTDATVQ